MQSRPHNGIHLNCLKSQSRRG